MNPKTREWIELERVPREPYVRSKDTKIHLFIRGENRVVCLPNRPMGSKVGTTNPAKVTCRNCILKKKYANLSSVS